MTTSAPASIGKYNTLSDAIEKVHYDYETERSTDLYYHPLYAIDQSHDYRWLVTRTCYQERMPWPDFQIHAYLDIMKTGSHTKYTYSDQRITSITYRDDAITNTHLECPLILATFGYVWHEAKSLTEALQKIQTEAPSALPEGLAWVYKISESSSGVWRISALSTIQKVNMTALEYCRSVVDSRGTCVRQLFANCQVSVISYYDSSSFRRNKPAQHGVYSHVLPTGIRKGVVQLYEMVTRS